MILAIQHQVLRRTNERNIPQEEPGNNASHPRWSGKADHLSRTYRLKFQTFEHNRDSEKRPNKTLTPLDEHIREFFLENKGHDSLQMSIV